MQFVLLIYQGTTPTPKSDEWKTFSDEEKKTIYAAYEALNKTPGVMPGLPLGLPQDATTVRVQNGKTLTTKGPYVDVRGAVGGYFVLEAENVDAAIKVAARVPAARLGGAIEIRPAEKYW
jgi:hypothetical protein